MTVRHLCEEVLAYMDPDAEVKVPSFKILGFGEIEKRDLDVVGAREEDGSVIIELEN